MRMNEIKDEAMRNYILSLRLAYYHFVGGMITVILAVITLHILLILLAIYCVIGCVAFRFIAKSEKVRLDLLGVIKEME